ALARHLADGAAEVHVEVIDAPFADEEAHGLADVAGIDAVELKAARRLLGAEAGEQQRLPISEDERARGDHLAHVEAGAKSPTKRAEGWVRDPRHRGKDDRGPDAERPDRDRRELS